MNEKIKEFFKKSTNIKALIVIAFYAFIIFVFSPYLLTPLINIILKATTNKGISDLSKGTLMHLDASINLGIYIILFLTCAIPYLRELKHDASVLRRSVGVVSFLATWFLILYAVDFATGILNNIINGGETSTNQESINTVAKYDVYNYIILFVTAVFIGPIVEEVVFRQAFFDVINKPLPALIISSLFFASIHIHAGDGNLLHMIIVAIPYFASGIVFGLTYEKGSRNIWLPILVHSISNAISLIVLLVL